MFKVTVTLQMVAVRPATLMDDGYGEAVLASLIVTGVTFANTVGTFTVTVPEPEPTQVVVPSVTVTV